jgi:hypothetical protein
VEHRQRVEKRIDRASTFTVIVTTILFVIAIFEKGFTHELLLEAGVFLVSVKLILASAKTDIATKKVQEQLDEIQRKLDV